jgi:phasin
MSCRRGGWDTSGTANLFAPHINFHCDATSGWPHTFIANRADASANHHQENVMIENTAAARARTAKPLSGGGSSFDPSATPGAEAVRDFAQQGAAYSRDMFEKTKAAAEQTNKALEQTFATASKGAAEFNQECLEMARHNVNAAFDLAAKLAAVKSPAEFFELSAEHARKQVETFGKQAQHLAELAQKVTTDTVQPLQAGVTKAFDKVA